MADDIDELLDEVESKYINSEDDSRSAHAAAEKSSQRITDESGGGGAEELDAAIHSICSIPEPIETTIAQNVVLDSTSKRRCTVLYVGEATSEGLSSTMPSRRSSTSRRSRLNSTTKIYTKRFFAKPVFELSVKDLEAENARRKQKEVIEKLFERKLAVVTDKMILDARKFKRIKSNVWGHFGDVRLLMSETEVKKLNIDHHVIHINDEEVLLCKSFVACVRCSAVFSYESHSYGTSTLRSHLKSCGKPRFNKKDKNVRGSRRRRSFEVILNSRGTDSNLPKPVFQKFRDDCLHLQKQMTAFFLSKQRPFETVSNPEFQKLLQACVKIGSTSGKVGLGNILCSANELSENQICTAYNKSVAGFESDMQNVYGVSFSFEIWVDIIKNMSYLSVICYYSDDEGAFKSLILQTFEFSFESKSGDDLNNIFLEHLNDMNLHLYKRILVIDYSPNMFEAFEREQYIYCICYCVNYAVQSVIDIVSMPQDNNPFSLPSFVTLVDQCRLLVMHFKQKKIQHNLPNHLHLGAANCWRSILMMVKSINNQWDHIVDVLGEREELSLFDISEELMSMIVDFLEIFQDGIEELASITHPTLNIVIPWLSKWKTHCLQVEDESPFLSALKSYMSAQIDAEVTKNVSLYHKLATMLDPRFKELHLLTEEDRAAVRNEAGKFVKDCEELISENKAYESPSCYILPENGKCSNLYPNSCSCNEVDNYLSEPFVLCAEDLDGENIFNPLKYWVRVKNRYPRLNRVASWILSCPASSLRNNERELGNWMVSVRETEFPSEEGLHLCMFSKSYKDL